MKAPGRNELCPCGSDKKFKRCHGQHTPPAPEFVSPLTYVEGETPSWLRELVHDAVCQVFDDPKMAMIGPHGGRCVRGELCAEVATITSWLLRQYGVASRFVCGSAQWAGYPIGFQWKGEAEYHAWVETQHGEFVDLACDSLGARNDLPSAVRALPSPTAWWGRPGLMPDRNYEEAVGGWKQINVDPPDSPSFLKVAQRALQFARANEAKYREEFSELAKSEVSAQ
jgi:hypothetical protein